MSKDSSVGYTASQLGQLSGIGARNVRYYVREKLIDPPHGRGRGAHFDDSHLSQLGRVRLKNFCWPTEPSDCSLP